MPTIRHRSLTAQEVLEYIAFAVLHLDAPDDFDGEITCELNEDGTAEIYASSSDEEDVNTEPTVSKKITGLMN